MNIFKKKKTEANTKPLVKRLIPELEGLGNMSAEEQRKVYHRITNDFQTIQILNRLNRQKDDFMGQIANLERILNQKAGSEDALRAEIEALKADLDTEKTVKAAIQSEHRDLIKFLEEKNGEIRRLQRSCERLSETPKTQSLSAELNGAKIKIEVPAQNNQPSIS